MWGQGWQEFQGTVHPIARSSLLTIFLPDVNDGELCLTWSLASEGVGAGRCPRANLSLSSPPTVSPWVSLCSSPHALPVSIKLHSVLPGRELHLISSHLSSRSWHCLSMAISSRLALWEQKESSTQGLGCSLRGQPDPPSTRPGPAVSDYPLPPQAAGLTSRAPLVHVQAPFHLPPQLAMASLASPGISDHALDSSHGCWSLSTRR